MTKFADIEPEDAWDTLDPIPEQLANINRRLVLLEQQRNPAPYPPPGTSSYGELVAALQFRLWFFRQHRSALSARDQVRVDQIVDDLEYIRRPPRNVGTGLMAGIFYTDLIDVLEAAGITVAVGDVNAGWELRAAVIGRIHSAAARPCSGITPPRRRRRPTTSLS